LTLHDLADLPAKAPSLHFVGDGGDRQHATICKALDVPLQSVFEHDQQA